jgi:CMP-N-acetylneuraminic acid synthetase
MRAIPLQRSARLATDSARTDDAAREAVEQIEAMFAGGSAPSASPPLFVILYANVPVRPEGLIDRALDLLVRSACDSVQSCQPVGKFHPWWTARVGEDGRVQPWEGDVLNHGVFRRQDLPPAFIPDGGVIALTRRALFLEIDGCADGPHAFLGRDRRAVINPEGSVVDIDSELDVRVAEAVLSQPSTRDHAGATIGVPGGQTCAVGERR